MQYEVFLAGGVPVKAWVRGVDLEEQAKRQLLNISRLPFVHSHVAAMPDTHWGIGATVGSVIPTVKAIIPAAVGVDIGCGMNAVRLSLKASQLPDNLLQIRNQIERDIPLGTGGKFNKTQELDRSWTRLPPQTKLVTDALYEIAGPKVMLDKICPQLGTLGSGNHFIEVCIDENQDVWVMLHSGSRGIGNMIGRYYIEKAKRLMEKFYVPLSDQDLAYFPEDTEEFDSYVAAMHWAQEYAYENRKLMMELVIAALRRHIPVEFHVSQEAINCHHNYVRKENHFGENVWLTRKGAVDAHEGVLGIIPGSMGAKSYIVRGKGNRDSFCSCSHGAGRKLSRSKAEKIFTVDDHAAATAGVECRKDAGVIDETPGAYKDIDAVMAAQSDLVEIVHTLKQVVCVKG